MKSWRPAQLVGGDRGSAGTRARSVAGDVRGILRGWGDQQEKADRIGIGEGTRSWMRNPDVGITSNADTLSGMAISLHGEVNGGLFWGGAPYRLQILHQL